MMKLLAWDTSSRQGALVALESSASGSEGPRLAGEWSLSVDLVHSERLLWSIDQMLQSARWKLRDVDCFGVGIGPGSFTGVRIGVTTARTLSHAMGKPLVGVSSLAALARSAALWLPAQTLLIAATDACKGELFALWGEAGRVAACAAVPAEGTRGLWDPGVEEKVIAPEELTAIIAARLAQPGAPENWLVVGEAKTRYPDIWRKLPVERELKPPVPFLSQIEPRSLGLVAWEAFQAGLGGDGLRVSPRYVRASDAELKLKAGLLKPSPV